MRIAFVGAVPPLQGGIAQHGAGLVRALRELGHDVVVQSWSYQYPRWLYPAPQRTDAAPFPRATYQLRWWDPLSWRRAGRAVRRADLLVFPWITPLQTPALRTIVSNARARRVVAVVHNPRPHEAQPFVASLTRAMLRRVDGVVLQSRAGLSLLGPLPRGTRRAFAQHPPNLVMDPRDPPVAPPYRLLFFGFVRPYKGVETLIEAVALLRGGAVEVEATVAGQIWGDPARWRTLVEDRSTRGSVTLRPGYVPDEEVPRLFAEHHVIVVPYRSATQSGVVPLAYAAGRPVIASDVGGLSEQVVDGVTGVLVPPGDAPALARAVLTVADRYDALRTHAQRATPTWTAVAHAVLDAAGNGA